MLPDGVVLDVSRRQDLLGGVTVVNAAGLAAQQGGETRTQAVTLIPHFAWANRGKGEMPVWLRNK